MQPQLIKQEVGCLECCLRLLLLMDQKALDSAHLPEIERRLLPLGVDTLHQYYVVCANKSQLRSKLLGIVVVILLEYFVRWPEELFLKRLPHFYDEAIVLLELELPRDLREALVALLKRVGASFLNK